MRMPTYTASQLLLGRATERMGDVALAYSAFRAVAARSPLALKRVNELHARALEIVANRLDDSLRGGKLPEAGKQLELLRSWAPSEAVTFEAARKVAVAQGDHAAELTAVKDLISRRPGDRSLLERRSELELEVGDPSAGLKIVQNLAAEHPKDPALAQKLESAKFRWRLSQLPRDVQEVAARAGPQPRGLRPAPLLAGAGRAQQPADRGTHRHRRARPSAPGRDRPRRQPRADGRRSHAPPLLARLVDPPRPGAAGGPAHAGALRGGRLRRRQCRR